MTQRRPQSVGRWQSKISLSVLLIAIIWPSLYQQSCAIAISDIADSDIAAFTSPLDPHPKTNAERSASESSLKKRAGPSQPIPIPKALTRLNLQALSDNDIGPEPTGPMSDIESGPDIGDATDDDIFGAWEEASLGPMPEVRSGPNQFTYPGPERAQKPLRNLPLGAWDDLWKAAEDRGLALRKALEHYAGCRKNRLADLEAKERPGDIELFYQTTSYLNQDLRQDYNELEMLFEQSGISFAGVNNPQFYTIVNVRVRDASPAIGEVISVGINTDTDTMLSLSSWRKEDINGDGYRLRSSELTWQTWRNFAGRNARKLRYMGRIRITNQESQNVMTLAHQKYPDNIDKIPLGRAGEPLGPAAGHGKWTPDDPAFNALLSTPNVKPVVHMLADHAAELDNNYIVEIHTIPEIARYMGTVQYRNTARPEDYRDSNMMIVLGPKPVGLAAEGSCSGVQTVAAADTVTTS